MRLGNLLEKHRNLFLVALMAATFIVGTQVNRAEDAPTVSIPVIASHSAVDPVADYRQRRDAATLRDMAALETIINRSDVDSATRNSAADSLAGIVASREASAAIEGALLESGLSPCVVVVDGASVTVVTGASAVAEADAALVLEVCALYAGATSADVRIITAE